PKTIHYEPAPNKNGKDAIIIGLYSTVDDSLISTRPVSIVVSSVNDCPTTEDINVHVPKNRQTKFNLPGSDIDDTLLYYTIVTQPTHGIITRSGNQITYNPTTDFVGQDSFTFKV